MHSEQLGGASEAAQQDVRWTLQLSSASYFIRHLLSSRGFPRLIPQTSAVSRGGPDSQTTTRQVKLESAAANPAWGKQLGAFSKAIWHDVQARDFTSSKTDEQTGVNSNICNVWSRYLSQQLPTVHALMSGKVRGFSCTSSTPSPERASFPFTTAAVTALRSAWIDIKSGGFTAWLIGVADDTYHGLRGEIRGGDGEKRQMDADGRADAFLCRDE